MFQQLKNNKNINTTTDANNNVATETLAFGINGSLRKREVQYPMPYTEYYLFNSAANLKAYSNNGLDFAYYGYNASNTRTYKLNFLNANSWVNGRPFFYSGCCGSVSEHVVSTMSIPFKYVDYSILNGAKRSV